MPRATTGSCSARKAARCSPAWRKALERGLVGKDERVLLFNCANGNKYPLPDRSKRLKLAEADPRRLTL